MKTTRFMGLIVLCVSLVTLAAHAEESKKVVPLADSIGIKQFTYATIIYSPKGLRDQDGRITSYVSDRAMLSSLRKHLSDFPARGGVYKQWPEDIDHWRVYIHGEDGRIMAMEIYHYSLQSPLDSTFVSNEKDPTNAELMKLLREMLQTKKKG